MSAPGATSAAAVRELDRGALARLLAEGHAIDPDALDGWIHRGVSLGLPGWVDRLAWKTFAKAFHRDPTTGHLRGWNVRIEQTGFDGPYVPLRRRGAARTFGHFRVVAPESYPMPKPAKGGLLLDYGLGGNPALDPTRLVRDPIVSLQPGDPTLLLGWTYLDLGRLQVGTPSFFTLERWRPVDEPVAPPRPEAAR